MADSDANKLLAQLREAFRHLRSGRRTDALLIYDRVRERAASIPQVHFELGNLCQEIGDVDRAIPHYEIAAREASDNPIYVGALGLAYLNAQEFEKAGETLERAIEIYPDIPEVQHGIGVYYMHRADNEKAVDYLGRSCELKPGDVSIRISLVRALIQLSRHDEALAQARKAVRLDDSNPDAQLALCSVLVEAGQMKEAEQRAESVIRRHRSLGQAYELLARIRKFSAADDGLVRKAEKTLDQGMPPKERIHLHYALGKMHDDCSRYDEAFAHFGQANLLQKSTYDARDDDRLLKDMRKAFTSVSLEACAGRGHPSAEPVFIVGMPRSGTTLTERIIASHPRGAGAGEVPEVARIFNVLFPKQDRRKAVARAESLLTREKLHEVAESYLAVLGRGRAGAERIVDKTLSNFFFLGLIKTTFPNATIINVARHPLDSCLSCYFQNFAVLPWANDLKWIAQLYTLYRRAIEYWRRVLPEGSILDIRYEQLVDDPETQSRRMLEACGLDWDPSVLEFFRKKGVVRTASFAQTRMPIYTTSKARWMSYAKHLRPLAADLAPYLQEDRELLAQNGIEVPATSGLLKRLFG